MENGRDAAANEIEITPEMRRAGFLAIESSPDLDQEGLAIEVYIAMSRAKRLENKT
jgi:hypothetical protein